MGPNAHFGKDFALLLPAMSVTKTDKLTKAAELSPATEIKSPKLAEKIDPEILLDSLKKKQKLFATLEEQGLINHNRHQKLGEELSKTIEELETLIPQLK